MNERLWGTVKYEEVYLKEYVESKICPPVVQRLGSTSLLRFFRMLGKERTNKLQFICSDMWQAYLKVIAKKASQAIHVLDRFHVVQKLGKAIDKVRAAEVKQLKADGYEEVLKGGRWLLLKRPENLSENQAVKLSELLQYNLKSIRSYLMKEDFQQFWTYRYPANAGKFLDAWCTRAMRSKIEPMKAVARTLRSKRDLLLNWFRADRKLSSGVVEGFNNKVELVTRKSYGHKMPMELRYITISEPYPNPNSPTNSSEQA